MTIISDKIIIKGLKIFAFHGVNDEEKKSGQTFIVDLKISTDFKKNLTDDDINLTINYAKVKKIIEKIIKHTSFNLIETISEKVSEALFSEFPQIKKLKLTIKKPEAPMRGSFDYVGVQIERERKDYNE